MAFSYEYSISLMIADYQILNRMWFWSLSHSELTIDNVKHPPKPFGTDDGFKGAGAACGSSIVKVAKSLTRGFSVAKWVNESFIYLCFYFMRMRIGRNVDKMIVPLWSARL